VEATEELWIYRLKTKRDNHDPIAVVLFAGGGGVESGMLKVGIEPIVAVEFDPTKPKLSKAIADAHQNNFPYCRIIRQTVQEVANQGFPGFPLAPDILWASPVCANFSVAKNGSEQVGDVVLAKAVVAALTSMRPKHFFLENVTGYQKSFSWRGLDFAVPIVQTNQLNPSQFLHLLLHPGIADIYAVFVLSKWVFFSLQEPNGEGWRGIESHLAANGYQVASSVVNMSDYGVPQARKRFIAIASLEGKPLPLPFKQPATGWYDAIADLIPNLPESQLLKGQQKEVDEFLKSNPPTPLLINRSGGRGRYRAVPSYKPANTIMRSHFTDGKNANRTKFADIWLPDGTVKSVSIECIRRLQSFPDWYQLPEQIGVAGSILGYSVPPKFVELLLKPLACRADNPNPIEEGQKTSNGLNGGSQINPEFRHAQLPRSRRVESGEYTGLSIAEIRRDGATQPREKLDLNHIATLKEAIEDGAELEPVVVFYDGSDYWLADGFHRCKASEESGLEDIPVVIHQGTRRDAILYSVGANAEHKAAKPRSRADKRRAVTMLLNDPEWSKWSDREIARQCKVSNFFVSKLRRDSLTVINHSENENSENEAKTRTYTTKHGTTTIMQTGNIGKKDEKSESNTSAPPIQGEELNAADGNGNGNGNGEMETDKTKPTIDPNDYAIAFMTNIDHINPDLLKVARQRIDERLAAIDKPST
jgi:DNA (cytosine-5)-methyltransferase 1